MCSKCVLDPGTFCGWCPVCGCALGTIDGKTLCTEEECWCVKQPDVGDWHTLRDPDEKPLPPDWMDRMTKLLDEGFD